jgi:uncharacterized membrane protein YheB (UPF0754 family)
MQWDIIIGPVIGAVIGYVTNLIAVQMLFHPINPVYIGKFRLPFTPGIIPKGKARFAKAIGNVVGNNLLNAASIKDTLLSQDTQEQIGKQLDLIFEKITADQTTLEVRVQALIGESARMQLEEEVVRTLSEKISSELTTMDLGRVFASEVTAAIQEKVQGTMLAMFVKPAVLEPIEDGIRQRVNVYINEHGEEKVKDLIQKEYTKLNEETVSSLVSHINTKELKVTLLKFYRMLVTNYSDSLLAAMNLSKIAEEKVNAMDTKEVEELVLSIMKKELGAVVNLGAVIGLILGLVNLLF